MGNSSKVKLEELHPALKQLKKAGVTDEMWKLIGKRNGVYAEVVYNALMEKVTRDAKTVEVSGYENERWLINEVKRALKEIGHPFTSFSARLAELVSVDLEAARGKTFNILYHHFSGRRWTISEGRVWQKAVGADGNAAAFLQWVMDKKPLGASVSIINDFQRLNCDPYLSTRTTQYFGRYVDRPYLNEEGHCWLELIDDNEYMDERVGIVAFREC